MIYNGNLDRTAATNDKVRKLKRQATVKPNGKGANNVVQGKPASDEEERKLRQGKRVR